HDPTRFPARCVSVIRRGARVRPAARVRPLVPRPLRRARRQSTALERQYPLGRAVPGELGIPDDRISRVRHVRRVPGTERPLDRQFAPGVRALVDQAIGLLGKGLEAGITPPRVTLRDVPDQIRGITPDDPMASPLLRPFAEFPPAIPASERERLTRTARDAYTQRVAPAYRKLYDYFVGSYVPKPRESIGMRELPDGAAWYAYRVRQFTTTTLSPDQIHALGLREVKRIRALMD